MKIERIEPPPPQAEYVIRLTEAEAMALRVLVVAGYLRNEIPPPAGARKHEILAGLDGDGWRYFKNMLCAGLPVEGVKP